MVNDRHLGQSDDLLASQERKRGSRIGRYVAVCAAVIAVVAAGAWTVLTHPFFAVKHVDIYGQVDSVGQKEIAGEFKGLLGTNLFLTDTARIRQDLMELDWIKQLKIYRSWPDGLSVYVQKHKAVAIWDDGRLVSDEGVLFTSNDEPIEVLTGMPNFEGDPMYVKEAVAFLPMFEAEAKKIDARVKGIGVTFRGSWWVVLESESRAIPRLKVELGRALLEKGPVDRLRQVVENYDRVADILGGYPEKIDARYRNAFAAQRPDMSAHRMWSEERGVPVQDEPESEGERKF